MISSRSAVIGVRLTARTNPRWPLGAVGVVSDERKSRAPASALSPHVSLLSAR